MLKNRDLGALLSAIGTQMMFHDLTFLEALKRENSGDVSDDLETIFHETDYDLDDIDQLARTDSALVLKAMGVLIDDDTRNEEVIMASDQMQALKKQLRTAMPYLEKNCGLAYQEWMKGELSRGAFETVNSRMLIAAEVIERTDLRLADALRACAIITIDVRSVVEEDSPVLTSWLEFWREVGYTEMHPILDFPVPPKVQHVS